MYNCFRHGYICIVYYPYPKQVYDLIWIFEYPLVYAILSGGGEGGQLVVKRSGRFLDLLIRILGSFETIITYVVLTLKNTTVDVT